MNQMTFVGLDVSKAGIEAVIRPTGEQWIAGIDDSGISETADMLSSVRPAIVVMEALGGMELSVAGTLAAAGLPLAFVPRRHVRDFERSIGGGMREERSHAGLLAYFAELVRPEVRLPENLIEHLKALKTRRQEVLNTLAVERNRQDTEFVSVQRDIRSHISFLEKSVLALTEEINRAVRSSSMWR
jgi:transposase